MICDRKKVRTRLRQPLVIQRGMRVLLVVLLLILSACANEPGVDTDTARDAEPTSPVSSPMPSADMSAYPRPRPEATVAGASDATLDEILDDPEAYLGQTVAVEGRVNVVKGNGTFTIASNTLVDANEVLVVGAANEQFDQAVQAGNTLRVTGTVRRLTVAEIERELSLDLDPEVEAEFSNKPVIVATLIDPMGEAAPTDATAMPEATATSNMGDDQITVADLVANQDQYIGKTVTITEEIDQVISPTLFSVDEDAPLQGGIDNDLLVIGGQNDQQLGRDQLVTIVGTVQQFDQAAIEQAAGSQLDANFVQDWTGRIVIMADSIEVQQADISPDLPLTDPDLIQRFGSTITVAEIASNLEDFSGKTLTVRQRVETVIGPNAFTLDEDALLQGGIDTDLLVVSSRQNLPVIGDDLVDQQVAVRGTVRPFNLAEVEQEIGFDLDDAAFGDWAGRPALIAHGIRPLDSVATPPEPGPQGDLAHATVAEITGNAEHFVGTAVAVSEEVEEVINQHAFMLDEDAVFAGGIDNDLLVVRGAETVAPFTDTLEGQTVQVLGTVRIFDLAAIEQESGFDLDDRAFEAYTGKPVIVANTILVTIPMATIPLPINADPISDTLTIADVAGNPAAYLGKRVTVRGTVEEVIHPGIFSLDEDALLAGGIDADLLVIRKAEDTAAITEAQEDQEVIVAGTVRPFVTVEIEGEYGLDFDNNVEAEYSARPVIIAESVQVVE